jgi:hypothetical protein
MTSQWQPVALLRELWTKLLAWPHLLKVTAGVLLIIAVILALFDRVAAGSLVAALFVVVALFEFLPQMESFAAFGIKAQWRKKLDEAEEILEKLKQSTKASAQLGYYLLGWGSRMGGRTASKKQDVADQIDKALTNLDVDPDTLATFKRDYLFFARYDLFQTFSAIASLNIRENNIQENKLSPKPTGDLLEQLQSTDFRPLCHGRIPKAELPPQDAEVLEKFADRVADIEEECRRTSRVTDEAIKLIDAYRIEDRRVLYRQLFGREPTS